MNIRHDVKGTLEGSRTVPELADHINTAMMIVEMSCSSDTGETPFLSIYEIHSR
jgi:hypothetical protein